MENPGTGGAGGPVACGDWTYVFGCDVVLPSNMGRICQDYFAAAAFVGSVGIQERTACEESGGVVVSAPCPGTSTFGSCIVADRASPSLIEYARQYAYFGTPGLTAAADRTTCLDDGNSYVPAGDDAANAVPSIVCSP
jgi:hypothetical protein